MLRDHGNGDEYEAEAAYEIRVTIINIAPSHVRSN